MNEHKLNTINKLATDIALTLDVIKGYCDFDGEESTQMSLVPVIEYLQQKIEKIMELSF